MNHVFTIPSYALRAMLQASAEDDIRYYLNSVHVDTQRKALVATDGHCMFIHRVSFEDGCEAIPSFTIPRSLINNVLKLAGKKPADISLMIESAEFTDDKELKRTRKISMVSDGTTTVAPEIDGRYPDWTRVVPDRTSGEVGYYDTRIMTRMFNAFQLATDIAKGKTTFVTTRYNGLQGGALLVCSDPNLLAIVMPMRIGTHEENSAMELDTLTNLGFKQQPIASPSIETDVAIAA